MSELPYMPVTINDEMAETADLTNEELGALTRLKWALWKSGGHLPDDQRQLARIARAGSRWGKIAPAVLAKLIVEGGQVSSAALLATLWTTRERRAKKAKAGDARWRKPEGPLTSSNPLKTNKVGGARASPVHEQEACNTESKTKNKDLRPIRPRSAAGPPDEGASNETSDIGAALYQHGVEILCQRVGLADLAARRQISRWLTKVGALELAGLIADADRHNLQGANFVNVVDRRVAALADEQRNGLTLPLMPPRPNRGGSG